MQIENIYPFTETIKIAYWLMRTKFICRKARLIRFPFDIRGRKYIDLGENLTTGKGCRIEAFSHDKNIVMHFGYNVQINDYVHICAMQNVSIGNDVLMASHIYISDNSHGSYKGTFNDSSPDTPPAKREYAKAAVVIEDNVWIGEHVVVLPGVTIGRGSVIGSNSVVSKIIPPYSIAVGQPAEVIKRYNFETKCWESV